MRWHVAFACATLVGCSGGTDFVPLLYDTCLTVDECVETATRCEGLAVEFAGVEFTNAICTTECASTGPLAADCARAFVGRNGSCYPSRVAGGRGDTLVCFEPCDFDTDCLLGFRCLGAIDLCGADANCPIDPSDAICVPGPS